MTMRRLAYILIALFVLGALLPAFAAEGVECAWKLEMLDSSGADASLSFGVAAAEARGTTASPGFPTPDSTMKYFAWNLSNPLNTKWWPDANPGDPYLYRGYTQKVAAKDALQFACDWHLVVYTVENENNVIAPTTHTYRLSVDSGTFPVGSQVTIRRDSDSTVIATMTSDATEPIEFELLGGTSDGTSFAPVYYTVSVECAMVETTFAYSLASGWNLIGIPFAQVLDATALFEAGGVFTASQPWTQLTLSSDLECGNAYWVFNQSSETVEAKVTGRASTHTTTGFPDSSSDSWRSAAVVAQWKEGQGFIAPAEAQTITRWNGLRFERVSAVPDLGIGYFIR